MKTKKHIYIQRVNTTDDSFEYTLTDTFEGENRPTIEFNKTYTPIAGDKIYIFPDSNVPRFKIKGFCEKYNVSICKFKESANVLIADSDTISDDIFDWDSYTAHVDKEYFINYIKTSSKVGDLRYVKLLQDLIANPEDKVLIASNAKHQLVRSGINGYRINLVEHYGTDEEDKVYNSEIQYKTWYVQNDEAQTKLNYFLSNTVYHRDAILAYLNEDTVIDAEMYEGLKSLFESNDIADHKVAMEAMANCDYLKSALYILLLFKDYRRKIADSDIKYHVNFKSMTKFFDYNTSRGGDYLELDDIVKKLVEKDIFDEVNMNALWKMASEEITDRYSVESFVIKTIEPTDELKEIAKRTTEKNNPVVSDNLNTI